MSTTIEVDLKDILAKLDQKLDKLDQKLDAVGRDVTDLKVGQARLEEKLSSVEKRMDFQEFLSKGVLFTLSAAVLGILAKLFGFIGNL